MANEEQLSILKQGSEAWNKWREENPDQLIDLEDARLYGQILSHANFRESNLRRADLSGAKLDNTNFYLADLRQANLAEADLTWANLAGAKLNEAILYQAILNRADVREADLTKANLSSADLREALLYQTNFHQAVLDHANLNKVDIRESNLSQAELNYADMQGARLDESDLSGAKCVLTNLSFAALYGANLREAELRETDLSYARLGQADLRGATLLFANLHESNLDEADLSEATLINTNLAKSSINLAVISRSRIHGVNFNDIEGEFKEQDDLNISFEADSKITVDNVFIAHFVSQILKRREFRDVFESWASRVVLLVGRFDPPKRNIILEVLKSGLREYNLLPLVYHLDHPEDPDFMKKIGMLAGISCFMIVDVTNPKSSPLKMAKPMPEIQAPIMPIIQQGEGPITMFADLHEDCEFVLDTVSYNSMNELMRKLKPNIIDPAIGKYDELRLIKAKTPTVI